MRARLFSNGELIGTCEIPGNDISVIRFSHEYYVYNDKLRGYEHVKAFHVGRIEYTPREIADPEARLPWENVEALRRAGA